MKAVSEYGVHPEHCTQVYDELLQRIGFVTQVNSSKNQLWEAEEITQWVKCLLRGMRAGVLIPCKEAEMWKQATVTSVLGGETGIPGFSGQPI